MRRCRCRVGSIAAVTLAALASARPAGADDLSLQLQPSYRGSVTTTEDQTGETRRETRHDLFSLYGITIDKELFPLLRFDAAARLDDRRNLSSTGSSGATADTRLSNLYGNLRWGDRRLGALAGYNRAQRTTFPAEGDSTTLINDSVALTGFIVPDGLPRITARFDRRHTRDGDRQVNDTTTTSAQVAAVYSTLEPLDLRYTFSYVNPNDALTGTDTTTTGHGARVTYRDRLWSGRMRLSADYGLGVRTTRVSSASADGTVDTQRYPIAGLSGITSFPLDPTEIALAANPALVDGDAQTGAGINIGYAPSVAGDTDTREVGARFAETGDSVNEIYVWVDRYLPPEIAGAYIFTAYTSDDNIRWEQTPILAPVAFATFYDRFEIEIAPTSAPYIKVVVAPLPSTATADAAFADVNVTELQFYEVVSADEVTRSSTNITSRFDMSLSTRLLRREDLRHELTLSGDRRHQPAGRTRYTMLNGLAYTRKIRFAMLSARGAREDADDGRGHLSAWIYTASATAQPIAALRHGLSYSGQRRETEPGLLTTNVFSLSNRATLYRGLSLLANLGYNFGRSPTGQHRTGRHAAVSTTVAPHDILRLTGTYGYARTDITEEGAADVRQLSSRVTGSASLRPVPALALTASVTALRQPGQPRRIYASYGGSFSPFPDGTLQLTSSYSESYDSSSQGTSRRGLVGLRWNVRPSWFADASYTYLSSDAPVGSRRSHVALATLTGRL